MLPRSIALVVVAVLLVTSRAAAVTVEGVEFPSRRLVEGRELSLQGAALLRYKVFLKAYVAALYTEPEDRGEPPVGAARRLEIEYFWSIPADGFADATREGIARNVDEASYAHLEPRIDALNAMYRDVSPGDRYALTYVPDEGTELALNGRPLGMIAGADFARAIFDIWLGPNPLDDNLKRELLGAS